MEWTEWLENNVESSRRRQMLVGRAKKLHDEGKTSVEIAEVLGIPESIARSLTKELKKQDRVNAKKNKDNPA